MKSILTVILLALASAGCTPQSPPEDGSARSERFIVYFGIVPAAVARASMAAHPSSVGAHPTPPSEAARETHHVLVAVFDAGTDERIVDAEVQARHLAPHGIAASTKPLLPMALGDTLSYGNTFAIAEGAGHRFEIEIRRQGLTDRVSFGFDNLHGSP